MLTKDRYVAALSEDVNEFLALASASPDASIEHCGDWDATDLALHIGAVWNFMVDQLNSRSTERAGSMRPPEIDRSEVLGWTSGVGAALLEAMAAVDSDVPIWSWTADKTAGFYHRRGTHETMIHLWDMRNATGTQQPLRNDLAADGISELLDVIFAEVLTRPGVAAPTGSLHLHATDDGGEWTAQLVDGKLVTSNSHEKADAAVKGPTELLNLMMWERVSPDSDQLQAFGDRDVLKSWLALSR